MTSPMPDRSRQFDGLAAVVPPRRCPNALPALLWLMVVGCVVGCTKPPYDVAPVSGTVTLDGKPLEGALINTQPIGSQENPSPGPGSFAKSDQDGRFALELVSPAKPGAVVGQHRVRITKLTVKYIPGKEDAPVAVRNLLPRSATDGSISITVPPEGTDELQLDLVSK
jgi:hypothetical protein